MKDQTLLLLLLLMLNYQLAKATQCVTRQSESNVFLYGFLIESSKVDSLLTCASKCKQNKVCASVNMNLMKNQCDLNYSTKKRHPNNIAHQTSMVYIEIRDDLGSTPLNPIPSCKWFKNLINQANSGVYWMKFNEPASVPFQVFCDMTTDGGGWTLVYSYTFTQYSNFRSESNAVTPIPNWPVDESSWTSVAKSTTTPLSESSRSAMDFALWKKIGGEILIKPNITNWVACVEGTGSLVNWVDGSVSCRVVKAITPTCTAVVPNTLSFSQCGVSLLLNGKGHCIHLEGRPNNCWPVHDPCGTSSANNHLTNITNPGGVLYIR